MCLIVKHPSAKSNLDPPRRAASSSMADFANELLRRHGELMTETCASCSLPMSQHFAATAVTPENPNGFVGCPLGAKARALVDTVADALVVILAAREGVSMHLDEFQPDVQEEYRQAAELALRRLRAIGAGGR